MKKYVLYTSKFWPMNRQMTFYGTTLNRFALLQLKINLSRTCSNCPHCLKIRTHFLIIPSGQGRMHACLSVSIPVVQSQTHLISSRGGFPFQSWQSFLCSVSNFHALSQSQLHHQLLLDCLFAHIEYKLDNLLSVDAS